MKSLHRDLCGLVLSIQDAPRILDLLQCTFEHTGRQEPGGCYSLRKLVIDYTSYQAKSLARYPRFRRILDQYGVIGFGLVAKLVQ